MKNFIALALTQSFLLFGTAAFGQEDHTVEVFPRGVMLADGSNVKITLKNDTNRPLYCEFLKAPVTLRDKEQDVEFDDYLEAKNVYLRPGASGTWMPDASIIAQYKADFPAIKVAKVGIIQPRCFFGATSPVNLGKTYMKKAFDPRGFYFYGQEAVANQPSTIDMWNAFRGTKIKTLNLNAELIAVDAYGHLILSDLKTKGTNNIIIYDPERQSELARINDLLDHGQLSPDHKYLTGSTLADWNVRNVWDLSTGKLVASSTDARNCYQMGEYPGQCAAVVNDGHTVQFYSLPELKLTGSLTAPFGGDIRVTSSFDGRYVALINLASAFLYEKVGNDYISRATLVNDDEFTGSDTQVIFSGVDYRVFVHTGRTFRIYNINTVDGSLVTIKGSTSTKPDYRSIAVPKDNSGLLFMDPMFGGVDYVRNFADLNWTTNHISIHQPAAYSPWTNMLVGNNGAGTTDTLYPLDN